MEVEGEVEVGVEIEVETEVEIDFDDAVDGYLVEDKISIGFESC